MTRRPVTSPTRRLAVELELADHEDLLAAAKRRGLTLQELAERLLVACLDSHVMSALLEEPAE